MCVLALLGMRLNVSDKWSWESDQCADQAEAEGLTPRAKEHTDVDSYRQYRPLTTVGRTKYT